MKEGQQIRPEWIPSAYKDEKQEVRNEGNRVKAQPTAPLYSGKKANLKDRISNARKKP
nr:hypothetical protein [uncultured Mucilaginibacter sp.]